jgi:AcrR family transcriptional regulator
MQRLPAKDRRAQLIDVAMQLFAEQGFDGTTTREIADRAGVNEAIIFRHFTTKEELYWAVVQDRVGASGRKEKIQNCLRSEASDRDILAAVAAALLDRGPEDSALTRLLLFTALRNAELSEAFFRTYMAENFDLLAEFFRQGAEQGRQRPIDPVIAARGFLGMVWHHCLVQELFGGNRHQKFDPRLLGQQLADIWLNGISTTPGIEDGQASVQHETALVPSQDGDLS